MATKLMDRRLKERLVGAGILAALVVLIVPELLSGPPRGAPVPAPASTAATDTLRSVTVDLATSKATPTEPPSASAASESSAPETEAAATPPPPPTIATLKAQQADTALEIAAATPGARPSGAPAPDAGAARHAWLVQAGSFASRNNAESVVRRLHGRDVSAFVSPVGAGHAARYRVRIGPFTDRVSAEKVMVRLRNAGETVSLVAP